MKKNNLVFVLLILGMSFAKAQTAAKVSTNQKTLLMNKWYESPRESSGDTIVFDTKKHIHQPGVDNPAMAFSEITFSGGSEFSMSYWRWCIKAPSDFVGKWNLNASTLKLDFGKQKCKCELTILDIQKDKLKVVIKETSN